MADALGELTYLTGGEAAARIARAFGLLVSADALLYQLKCAASPASSTPRVLGADDFAFKRGHVYGTILVDLEKRRPVDLLPDREADTFSAWLQEHPGVEIISRDLCRACATGGNTYIEGATKGAPQAVQVADRWHLLKNLGDALERFLCRHHRQLREAAPSPAAGTPRDGQAQEGAATAQAVEAAVPPQTPAQTAAQARACQEHSERRCRREGVYERVRQLYRQGCTQSEIARRTGLARQTIRKYLNAESCPHYPQRRRARVTVVSPFAAYLKQRWEEGSHNAAQLFQEVKAQGYRGQYSMLKDYLRAWRATEAVPALGRHGDAPSASTARWWLLGHFGKASPEERRRREQFVERLCALCSEVQTAQTLALEFTRLVRERTADGFAPWLEKVAASDLPELKAFAQGLVQDKAAVEAALSLSWSNGVEQRSGGGAGQPSQVPQAPDVWPRRVRVAAGAGAPVGRWGFSSGGSSGASVKNGSGARTAKTRLLSPKTRVNQIRAAK